jgi:hypothetical protein
MNEHDPVEDTESVYRRIHQSFFDPNLPIAVRREAFRPTANDTTGLSVFRSQFLKPLETLAGIDSAKSNSYYVARLAVRDLARLGLTVVPEPTKDGPAGHAVISQLSFSAYQGNKQRLKEIQLELARLASGDIVHRPM